MTVASAICGAELVQAAVSIAGWERFEMGVSGFSIFVAEAAIGQLALKGSSGPDTSLRMHGD